MKQQVETKIGDKLFTIQTGVMAKQADGAALVTYGDSVVLTTVVSGEPREGGGGGHDNDDFLPLTVDYREKTSAAGKIPGGFFKREGRPTTEEILTMRLIDRPMRPLFPAGYKNEIQIMSMVLSAEKDFDPDTLAINGASAALMLSGIPFNGPMAAVRIGRVNDKLLVNPTLTELKMSTLDLVIVGTADAVLMVEGGAHEVAEEVLLEAIEFGHNYIKELVKLQKKLIPTKPKQEVPLVEVDQKLYKELKDKFSKEIREKIQIKNKQERYSALSEIKEKVVCEYCDKLTDEELAAKTSAVNKAYSKLEKDIVRELILSGKRIDGRGVTDIRPITCELSLLPRTHGSALFTRGETQALVVTTLGTADDEQIIDGLMEEYTKKFMLHYNFPPFSTGEVKPLRGVGRREIGHGHLAERAIEAVLPVSETFPYTIRVVSDILESNGSSSMASVCGATLSLMDAGVPIKSPVAGIAMGLVKEGSQVKVLSDILGNEDKYGDMDFKVAGTANGITAFQMDIKIGGISTEILQAALKQAREGRLFILGKIAEAISEPRAELSDYAPRVGRIKINPDKIGMVIGTGGKTIRKLEEDTGATIEIKEDGEILVYCRDVVSLNKAKSLIEQMTEEAKIGKIYEGRITGIKDFGAFVEILPGQEGLVHISELAGGFVKSVTDVVKMGDVIKVKVIGIDDQHRIKLSRKQVEMEAGEDAGGQDMPKSEPHSRPISSGQSSDVEKGSKPPFPFNKMKADQNKI